MARPRKPGRRPNLRHDVELTEKEKALIRWTSFPETRLISRTKHKAHRRGIEFTITEKDIKVPKRCPALGIKLEFCTGDPDRAPSIDRIDNKKGYIPGNVVVVSYRANRIKSDLSLSDLVLVAKFYKRFM